MRTINLLCRLSSKRALSGKVMSHSLLMDMMLDTRWMWKVRVRAIGKGDT